MNLETFFAVTVRNEIYVVRWGGEPIQGPVIEKIVPELPRGSTLEGEPLLGITRIGLILYEHDFSPYSGNGPPPRQRPEDVNTVLWRKKTACIVGLFVHQEAAYTCLHQNNLTEADTRWADETQRTLAAIGDDHPVFIPSQMSDMAFPSMVP